MKQSTSRSRSSQLSGFTLVELLVVIAIIAILAAVLSVAAGAAIRAALRAKAALTANSIQTSVLSYYTEYSVYPVPNTAPTTTDYLIADNDVSGAWGNLVCALTGNIHPSNGLAFTPTAAGPTNTRAIPFLNLKPGDVITATGATQDSPKNPLPPTTTNLYFNLAIDADYDGVLGIKAPTLGKMPNFSKSTVTTMDYTGTATTGVAVWANCNTSNSTNPAFWVHTY